MSSTSTMVVGAKREHPGDDEEEGSTRRVSQRTETNQQDEEEDEIRSMEQLVLKDLHSDDQAVIVKALKQIWKKIQDEHDPHAVEAKKEFHQLGGHSIVVSSVMAKHPNNQDIQIYCLIVICNGSCNNDDFKISIAQVDGMQAVLDAVYKFPNSRLIQLNGLAALTNITWGNDSNATTLVQDLNGIPIIIGTMDRFSNDEDVACVGCLLLWWLCRLEDLRQPIFDTGALTALVKARDSFKENALIQKSYIECSNAFADYAKTL